MLIYEVYYKNYQRMKTERIAILPERRMDPLRQNGLKWARRLFGSGVQDPHSIFTICRKTEANP
jgi:hypothetical protein